MRKTPIPDRQQRRKLLTVYGRKAVQEALSDASLTCTQLHVASSNRSGGVVGDIQALAQSRAVPTREHTREELARISRNGRQDQGIALDVLCPLMQELDDFLSQTKQRTIRLIALDGVTNPQNMGMVIRSAAAAGIDGILYTDRGNPALGPLVIKASAGTVFKAPLLRCETLVKALKLLRTESFDLYRLDARGQRTLFDGGEFSPRSVFVLGGESEGLSEAVRSLSGTDITIPMANGVESLNVAVSAALLAFTVQNASRQAARSRRGP